MRGNFPEGDYRQARNLQVVTQEAIRRLSIVTKTPVGEDVGIVRIIARTGKTGYSDQFTIDTTNSGEMQFAKNVLPILEGLNSRRDPTRLSNFVEWLLELG